MSKTITGFRFELVAVKWDVVRALLFFWRRRLPGIAVVRVIRLMADGAEEMVGDFNLSAGDTLTTGGPLKEKI